MPQLELTILSLAYSSWSMRPWLALTHAGAAFEARSVEYEYLKGVSDGSDSLAARRKLGSVNGFFPVLRIDGTPIHESLAICEYVADAFPQARLWPDDAVMRAQARAVSAEMHSGFGALREELPCVIFARVSDFQPGRKTRDDIARIFEIWGECLERSGGPFLFGQFSIADAMYYPVLTRFRTFSIELPGELDSYAQRVESLPAVNQLIQVAKHDARVPEYDNYITSHGGDPIATLPMAKP